MYDGTFAFELERHGVVIKFEDRISWSTWVLQPESTHVGTSVVADSCLTEAEYAIAFAYLDCFAGWYIWHVSVVAE